MEGKVERREGEGRREVKRENIFEQGDKLDFDTFLYEVYNYIYIL